MSKLNYHSIINSIILLTLIVLGFFYYSSKQKQEVVYIDSVKLFNGFNMTKDIKIIEGAKLKKQGKELDSLYVIFQSIKDENNTSSKSLQQQIAQKSKAFQELQDNYSQNLSNNVWSRLNAYINEYAQINNLKIIFGANGNGNLMYGHESINVTPQILEFSNKKYEGNN